MLAKEATDIAFVASGTANLFDLEQNRIGVAVDIDFSHMLHMAARFPLLPEPTAAAAVVDRLASGKRLPPGCAVHVGKHQHFAAGNVLGDRGNEGLVTGKIGAVILRVAFLKAVFLKRCRQSVHLAEYATPATRRSPATTTQAY